MGGTRAGGRPEDPEIAALWQSLLGAIYQKETEAKEWLEVIKQLNESDARLLLRIPQNFAPAVRERARATKLVSLGLLESFSWWLGTKNLFKLSISFTPIVMGAIVFVVELLVPHPVKDGHALIGMGITFTAFGVITLVYIYVRYMNAYSITDLGRDIRRSAWRYLQNPPRVAESEMKDANAATEAKPAFEPTLAESKPRQRRQKATDTKIS